MWIKHWIEMEKNNTVESAMSNVHDQSSHGLGADVLQHLDSSVFGVHVWN